MKDALAEQKNKGTSVRELSKKYNIPKSSIMRHIKATNQAGYNIVSQGRKSVFNGDETLELNECIINLASLGFPLTKNDIGELVESYAILDNHQRALKIFKHKGRKGYPGSDWINSFIPRNDLSLKRSNEIECVAI